MPTPQEYQAQDEAFSKQFADQQAQKAQETAQAGQPQTFLQKWTAPVGRVTTQILDNAVSGAQLIYDTPGMKKARDVAAGAITGATNIADSVLSHTAGAMAGAADQEDSMAGQKAQAEAGVTDAGKAQFGEPIWDHAKSQILDFRDAVQVQDPTLADSLTQGVAQLAIPFAGYSRALSGMHWVAQAAAAGAITDATALGPHDARMADMLALGRHTEGKFGEVLRTLAPDGSALNAYINYLHDRTNETEAEGRFKNVLDGFGVNLVATPLLHSVGMLLKQGTAGLRYMVDNGVPSSGGLVPPQAQRGAVGDLSANGRPPLRQMAGDPAESLYEAEVRRQAAAAAANPNGKRPPLRQMADDPADPIFEQHVREDAQRTTRLQQEMDAGAKGWDKVGPGQNAYADSALNSMPAVNSFRRVLQSRAGTTFQDANGDWVDAHGKKAEPTDLSSLASKLATHLPDDGAEGSFYKDVLQRVAQKNPDSKFFVSSEGHPLSYNGAYNPISENTTLYPKAFVNNGQMVHTFAHEAVHAAVYHDIAQSAEVSSTFDALRQIVLKSEGNTHYGLKDVQEFIAEAESNPGFRRTLKATPAPDGKGSVWDRYKEAIGGILGLGGAAVASPMFDKLLTKDEEKSGA